jgi:hypothetical protein
MVRYVSGLGALPGYVHGYLAEAVSVALFVALVVWLFWLWTP